jgi:Tfp pilus assembly PilM family ATPase/Tfp pilus assembly protein PilN
MPNLLTLIKELSYGMYATLNISATSIRLLHVKGRQVKKWGSIPLAPGLVRDGLILQPKAVGTAIDDLFKSTKVPKKQVITSVTGLSFTYRILSLPRMKSASLEEAIQRAARKEMPLPLEELYLSWQALGGGHDELDFFVLGVPRNLVDAVVKTLAEAGIKPYLMEPKPLALARAANRGDVLIVDLEPDYFDIVLVADGIPAIMHTITPRGEGASIEDNIRRLTDELSKTVEFYNSSHQENPLSPTTPLLLTGELSAATNTSQLIQAETEYPVELLVPSLKFPPDLPIALYATNMGLALKKVPQKKRAAGFHDINLDILSVKHRARVIQVSWQFILLTLVLALAIGFLFPMYRLKNEAGAETIRFQTELSGVSQELHQVRLDFNQAEQIEDATVKITAELDALKQEHQYILSKGGNAANNLGLVTTAIPAEAYFTSIEMGTDQITIEGEADNPFTIIDYVKALEAQGVLSEVRIAEIDESTETGEAGSAGITFTIAISK